MEAPSLLGQGLQHGGGEHGVDVRPRLQQAPPLGQGLEVQVDGGEPPLAGAQQALGLGGGDLHAAAVGVGPVSYTHLDVYKRQMLSCSFFSNARILSS